MNWYNVLVVLAIIVSVLFTLLVIATGKGDAMSGSTGVRTSYKGKATIEDRISQLTFGLGVGFMALMLLLDLVSNHVKR